jgi:hypothetical protein
MIDNFVETGQAGLAGILYANLAMCGKKTLK